MAIAARPIAIGDYPDPARWRFKFANRLDQCAASVVRHRCDSGAAGSAAIRP